LGVACAGGRSWIAFSVERIPAIASKAIDDGDVAGDTIDGGNCPGRVLDDFFSSTNG
jgi:hypothetical protein